MDRREGPNLSSEDLILAKPPQARSLVTARIGAGLTQAQAARATGVTSQHISDIECGRARPSALLRDRLADLYGLDR